MTDETPRRPGPWDAPAATPPPAQPETAVRRAEPPLIKGQHPVVAIGGTALFFGFIWWMSGSWVMATALIFGLFVHEYGHVLAMNRMGMGPARIFIIPFFGGLAQGQREPKSEWDGVLVSLAGPAFGLLAALPFFALWFWLGGPVWLLGAAVIAAINLVNLAPAPPLDGSRAIGPVLAHIHPWVERAAMIVIGVLVVYWGVTTGRWILAAFLALALLGHLRRGAWRPEGQPLSGGQALASVGLYLVTAAACAGVGLASLAPLAEGSFSGAMQIAGAYLGFRS
jgi:Zn-dependent protease